MERSDAGVRFNIVSYTRDDRGNVISRHLKDTANTLCPCNLCGWPTVCQYVLELYHNSKHRIRKLTPKECFRLMDVDDKDIKKIQDAGISKTQQYKMAGNSIVVACLDHILEAYYFPKEQPRQRGPVQLTLF